MMNGLEGRSIPLLVALLLLGVFAHGARAFQHGNGVVPLARGASMELKSGGVRHPRGTMSSIRMASTRLVLGAYARVSARGVKDRRRAALPATIDSGMALQAQAAGGDGEIKQFRLPVKQIALVCLVVQNACQMLSMRYSRIAMAGSTPYLASTAVVLSEFLKLMTCLVILAFEFKGRLPQTLYHEIIVNWRMTAKVGVPAFIYMIQNNLLFIAASNLDAATCQITYQLKILTTAIFAVALLGKKVSPLRWASLVILITGIVLVQAPSLAAGAGKAAAAGNPVVGLAAVISACFLSGFAGIWFEKILKGSDTSIWIRNIQLGGIGFIAALAASLWKDGAAIKAAGFFQGYTPLVWSVVGQVGCGGLLVALVVRYADNILKGFATSLSIIVSGLLSMYFIPALRFSPTPMWFGGTALVLTATLLYSLPEKEQASKA